MTKGTILHTYFWNFSVGVVIWRVQSANAHGWISNEQYCLLFKYVLNQEKIAEYYGTYPHKYWLRRYVHVYFVLVVAACKVSNIQYIR